MKKFSFNESLLQILKEDQRYPADAYLFVREALDFTSRILKKPARGSQRHVTAAELLEGIRRYALQEYGPMAKTILNYWGIQRCSDFGQIVFNLVNKHILRKTENDSVHDFDRGYDFEMAFRRPYQADGKCRTKKAEFRIKNVEFFAKAGPGSTPASGHPCTGGDIKKLNDKNL